MKNIKFFIIVILIISACTKQENAIAPKEIEKNLITQTGTSLNDTIKNTTTTTGIGTVTGCNSDSIYKDTVVHLDLATKQKLVGRWVETNSSYNSGSKDTIEFANDSRFYIHTKKGLGDESGNYNNYFFGSIFKIKSKDTVLVVTRRINFYSKLPRTLILYFNGEMLNGYHIDALMTHDIRFYEFIKLIDEK